MRIESLQDHFFQFPDREGIWNFEDLESTHNKLKTMFDTPESISNPRRAELLTQIARVEGLQGRLTEATQTLLLAKNLLAREQNTSELRAEISFQIEQGRLFALSMNSSLAVICFEKAIRQAEKLKDDFLYIESLVLYTICQPPKLQIQLLQKAMEKAEASSEDDGKLWLSQLYVMSAWNQFDLLKYPAALEYFKKALLRPQSQQNFIKTQVAKWGMSRTLRALDRLDEALDVQKELLAQVPTEGVARGYVSLEIGECLQLLKRVEESREFFGTAFTELSKDLWYKDNRSSELSRIQRLSKRQ